MDGARQYQALRSASVLSGDQCKQVRIGVCTANESMIQQDELQCSGRLTPATWQNQRVPTYNER